MITPPVQQRAIGAIVGGACADALGAPYEFGPPGGYRRDFPTPVLGGAGEMRGGGAFRWKPGEFTDDTQMGLALAESLTRRGGFDPDDLWLRWRHWAAHAPDVGNITRAALSRADWRGASEAAHTRLSQSAGNGALMRVAPVAVAEAVRGSTATTIELALAQSVLTHFDPAAGWGAAVWAELIRRTIDGADPIAEVADVLALMPADVRERFTPLMSPSWHPGMDAPGNGSVWGCIAQALWAVREHDSYHDTIVAAIDLGGDTDTVASVAGALAGARFGIQGIPSRWATYVNGHVDTPDGERRYTNATLQGLALLLLGAGQPNDAPAETPAGPQQIDDTHRVWAADLAGAASAADSAAHDRNADWAVLSLCRVGDSFADVPVRREVYLIDKEGDHNSDLATVVADSVATIDAWLAEGRHVLVHCHGGRSRTALVLKAWAMRRHGWDEADAHDWMADRWPRHDPWNDTFTEFLRAQWP